MSTFVVKLHDKGKLVIKNQSWKYEDGVVEHFFDFDPATWSFFEMKNVVEKMGYTKYARLWGRDPHDEFGKFKEIVSDKEVMELASLLSDGMSFELYVENDNLLQVMLSLGRDSEKFDQLYEEDEESEDKETSEERDDSPHPLDSQPPTKHHTEQMGRDGPDYDTDIDLASDELHSAHESSDEDELQSGKLPTYGDPVDREPVRLEVGMIFNTLEEFKDVVTAYAVWGRWKIKFVKNDRVRVRAKCDGCTWLAFASKMYGQLTYQLKTLVKSHTCSRNFDNPRLTARWLSKELADSVGHNPNMNVGVIQEKVQRNYVSQISRSKVYRARRLAQDVVCGNHRDQYAYLWVYCENLKRSNVGTTTQLKLAVSQEQEEEDGQHTDRIRMIHTFQRLYICLEGTKRGFLDGCRPFIGVDACHLKGPFGGQLIVAVGRDANDQIYPIAFAVVEAETKESWTWFMTLLIGDIKYGIRRDYTFISDQHQGLVSTLQDLIPEVDHRFCVRHIYNNLKRHFPGNLIKGLMWQAANATYLEEFVRVMDKIKAANESAATWLNGIPPRQWSKHAFGTHCKCDTLVNNICEVFNFTILEARNQPIISLAEWIRTYLMKRFQRNRDRMDKWEENVCPKIKKKLEAEKLESRGLLATCAGDLQFEVTNGCDKFAVNLGSQTCACRRWDITGVPCRHACCAIIYKGDAVENYVHEFYGKRMYELAYSPFVHPVNGYNPWHSSDDPKIHPPTFKIPPSWSKLRRREPNEPSSSSSNPHVSRKSQVMRCSKCLKYGHNKRSCSLSMRSTQESSTQDVSSQSLQSNGSQSIAQRIMHQKVPKRRRSQRLAVPEN